MEILALIVIGVLGFLGGLSSEGPSDYEVGKEFYRDKDIRDAMRSDRRGPSNLERNAKSRDPLWEEPLSKPSLFRPRR